MTIGMNRRRQELLEQYGNPVNRLHCPVCMKYRMHSRRRSGGMDVYTCKRCRNVQSYRVRDE